MKKKTYKEMTYLEKMRKDYLQIYPNYHDRIESAGYNSVMADLDKLVTKHPNAFAEMFKKIRIQDLYKTCG